MWKPGLCLKDSATLYEELHQIEKFKHHVGSKQKRARFHLNHPDWGAGNFAERVTTLPRVATILPDFQHVVAMLMRVRVCFLI